MMCITIFAAASERDNSQALVTGSCLSGEDGGNRWELECARLVRAGQRRKCRCARTLCVDGAVPVCFPKQCLLSDRKTET